MFKFAVYKYDSQTCKKTFIYNMVFDKHDWEQVQSAKTLNKMDGYLVEPINLESQYVLNDENAGMPPPRADPDEVARLKQQALNSGVIAMIKRWQVLLEVQVDRYPIISIVGAGALWGLLNPVMAAYLFIFIPDCYFGGTVRGMEILGVKTEELAGPDRPEYRGLNAGYDYINWDLTIYLYLVCTAIASLVLGVNRGKLGEVNPEWFRFVMFEEWYMGFKFFVPPLIVFYGLWILAIFTYNQDSVAWIGPEYNRLSYLISALSAIPFYLGGLHLWMIIRFVTDDFWDQ